MGMRLWLWLALSCRLVDCGIFEGKFQIIWLRARKKGMLTIGDP